MPEQRKLSGTLLTKCGGFILDESPVYEGEDPYGSAVWLRVDRAIRILHPTVTGMLGVSTQHFYPSGR